MKNRKIRNSLIAAGIAVLAGVLVLSVSVAIGDAPGYAPPSAAGVSPVFTDVEIQGAINRTGGAVSIGEVDPGLIALFGLTSGDLVLEDTVFAVGNISSGADTWVGGDLNFNSSLGAIKSPNGTTITIDEDLDVTGDITADAVTASNMDAGGWLETDDLYADYIEVYDQIQISGYTYVGGDLEVAGDVDIDGELYAPTYIETNDLFVGGDSSFEGTLTADNIDANDIVTGDLEADSVVVTSGGSIGSFYRIANSSYTTNGNYTLACYTGDIMVDCTGYANAGYMGSMYYGANSCRTYSSFSGSKRLYVRIKCFDPEGITEGAQ